MSSNIGNLSPYLPNSRKFPQDSVLLETELTKSYIDIASNVNIREIGIYDLSVINTGQQWFNPPNTQPNSSNQKRQASRQVYTFGTLNAGATATIAHGIVGITTLTQSPYGCVITVTPDFRGIPYVDVTNVTNQISVRADATNIYVVNGATAPNISSGFVVIDFLQQ